MTGTDEGALLAVAREAASAAAAELRARFGHRQEGVHAKSTPTDLVSDADLAAEAAIRSVLEARRPGDAILGEESGETVLGEEGREDRLRWLVDPLDGTINFLFGIPAFAVSVACEDTEGTVAGVVLDPLREECFAATRSGPPTLANDPIRASEQSDLATAMIATGFAYDARVRERQAAVVARVLPQVRDIRRVGAAAMDLCWSGCGRFDAYYERGLHPWDLAAGALIASRAGLELRELPADEDCPAGIVAAPPGLIDQLLGLVAGGSGSARS